VVYTKDQARELYFRFFFNPAYLKLRDKNLSKLLFKFSVQVGRPDSVKMLQEAVNRVVRAPLLKLTGTFSIDTLKACNELFNPNMLYDNYVVMISQYNAAIKPGPMQQLIRAVKKLF
jgi:lysozyme family protein